MDKTAVLLVNVGTPKSFSVPDVARYLAAFLDDPKVIDIPWLFRKILVYGIIVPFRSFRSARRYRKVWTPQGSLLEVQGMALQNKLQQVLGEQCEVRLLMRYGEPSLKKGLQELNDRGCKKLVLLPLFPHYTTSTTGSVTDLFEKEIRLWKQAPQVTIVRDFYRHPGYIKALVARIEAYKPGQYDHVLFTYHGLPVRQVEKMSGRKCVAEDNQPVFCPQDTPDMYCYRCACLETTRLLAEALNFPANAYSTAFQSRMGGRWIEPFTDSIIKKLAQQGVKKLLVVSPSFVADCLETTIEIGEEYSHLFTQSGGEKFQLVEALNTHPLWVEMLAEGVKEN